ncbi:FadR/GntR family transcriptional regulator [Roseinatronobacter sp.]
MPESPPQEIEPRQSQRSAAYDAIYERIARGKWPVGTKLPPETVLATELGVSRSILREALLRLRIDGIIESRQGAGTRVVNAPSRTVLDHVSPGAIADVLRGYEFRMSLEGEAAYQATRRADARRIAEIAAAHQRLIEALHQPAIVGDDQDIAFHLAIAKATDNSYFVSAVAAIIQIVRTGVRIASTLPHWTREERIHNSIAEHARILDAIRKGDAQLARDLMRQHIDEGHKRVFLGQRQR